MNAPTGLIATYTGASRTITIKISAPPTAQKAPAPSVAERYIPCWGVFQLIGTSRTIALTIKCNNPSCGKRVSTAAAYCCSAPCCYPLYCGECVPYYRFHPQPYMTEMMRAHLRLGRPEGWKPTTGEGLDVV